MVKRIKTKNAFTLAEVLITLVIIGVVAALTIPTAIAKYQKEQTVVKLKKVYGNLLSAYKMSVFENGPVETWTFDDPSNIANSMSKYIIPYLKITKNCGTNMRGCTNVNRATLNGSHITYINTLGGWVPFAGCILSDGTLIWGTQDEPHFLALGVDINGDKGPNKMGIDAFWFLYDKRAYPADRSFHHMGKPGFYFRGEGNSKTYLTSGNVGCNKSGTVVAGAMCGALIKLDGWEIKDDYPW